MDWREQAEIRTMQDAAEGTLQVVAVSSSAQSGERAEGIRLTGVLRVEGLPPTALEYRGDARPVKWPQRGQLLPVIVDRANPTGSAHLIVDWDRVPTHLELAERLAEQLRREGGGDHPPGVGASDGI